MFRSHNFSAGPSMLPTEVLEQAKAELLDYRGTGSSIMELSHRGPEYMEVDEQAKERIKSLMGLSDDYEVMFLQGGASGQFMMIPYNFIAGTDRVATYINTGEWSRKAIKEARILGKVHVGFSSEDVNFNRVPRNNEISVAEGSVYLHYTSNNTIFGTQFKSEPETGTVPLVCDASSDIMSRPVDVSKHGIIYAGAQKNAGISGVAIVIMRKDFMELARKEGLSTMFDYRSHAGAMYNTPPTFSIYLMNLVMGWILDQGGLTAIQQKNEDKAILLYQEIDSDDFYTGTAEVDSRSLMNVTFRLPDEYLEKRFVNEATALHLDGLKGHRSVGGIRASIYNAMPKESVQLLVDFMRDFRSRNG